MTTKKRLHRCRFRLYTGNYVSQILETGKVRFILSGSSARKLKRGGANLLAGRAWQRELYPLSLLEIGDRFSLLEALQYGTLPPLVDRTSQLLGGIPKSRSNCGLPSCPSSTNRKNRMPSMERIFQKNVICFSVGISSSPKI